MRLHRVRPFLAAALLAAALPGCNRNDHDKAPGEDDVSPVFVDATAASGVAFTSLPRTDIVGYGQGAALADFDGDGDLDLFLPQDLGPCALYRNDGGLAFTDVAGAAGVQVSAVAAHAKSAAFFDYDRDDDPDLFVGTAGDGNRLFRNEGDGTFTDVSAASGLGGGSAFTVSAVPGDYDGDGYLDLYEVDFVPADYGAGGAPTGVDAPNRLWHNEGDGTFLDVAGTLGVDDPRAGWAGLWIDVDDDGDQDLLVANDHFFYQGQETRDRAYLNGGAGAGFAFTDAAAALGLDSEHSGMGIAAGDLDGDGLLDLYVADIAGNELRLGSDAAPRPDRAPGLAVAAGHDSGARPQIAWGCAITDLDGDGRNDLLVANGILGSTEPGPGTLDKQLPRLFLARPAPAGTPPGQSAGGLVFPNSAAEAGLENLACPGARSALPADLDGDGDLDLVISTRVGEARILRNDTPRRGHWYGVRLRGSDSPPEGFGAVLELGVGTRLWRKWAVAGGQPGATLPPEWIFTPGPKAKGAATLTVRWPSGAVQQVVPARDAWTVVEEP